MRLTTEIEIEVACELLQHYAIYNFQAIANYSSEILTTYYVHNDCRVSKQLQIIVPKHSQPFMYTTTAEYKCRSIYQFEVTNGLHVLVFKTIALLRCPIT